MNRIIDFFVVGIKDFFRASCAGIFTIFIIGLFIIFIQELFWLLGYFGFTDFAVDIIAFPFYIPFVLTGVLILLTGVEIDDDPFLAISAGIIFAIALIIYIFILIIFAKITMKFLYDFKNKTYSKSFYFIVFLFFNYIYLFIFLGFKKSLISNSKFFEFSNENLLFLVLAFCLGLISTYLTKIKFFKGENMSNTYKMQPKD